MTTLRQPSQRRLRNTNNRQRKKLHLGDYRQLRGDISVRFKQVLDNAAFEAWLKDWIDWVESKHLYVACFGGAQPFATADSMLIGEKSLAQEQLDAAVAWLQARPEVAQVTQAALRDATYDEFKSVE
jgi:uncharacterized protein YggL (DUF469 family)